MGNTFTYFQFKDSYEIHPEDRDVFVAVLLTITCIGISINLLYLPMPWAAESKWFFIFHFLFFTFLYGRGSQPIWTAIQFKHKNPGRGPGHIHTNIVYL